jgi:peptide/nickel transport system ATP-binding protein
VNIARALALQPRLVILDEAVSALDKSVEAQVLNLLLDLKEEFGLTYVFISHDLNVVRYISDRVMVMYLGKVAEIGPVDEIYAARAIPTRARCWPRCPRWTPTAGPRRRRCGRSAEPDQPAPGCRFHTRCAMAEASAPSARRAGALAAGTGVACHAVPGSGHSDARGGRMSAA